MCSLQRNYDVIRNWERFETGPLTVHSVYQGCGVVTGLRNVQTKVTRRIVRSVVLQNISVKMGSGLRRILYVMVCLSVICRMTRNPAMKMTRLNVLNQTSATIKSNGVMDRTIVRTALTNRVVRLK